MQQVTMYQAADGSRWDTEIQAQKRQDQIEACDSAMAPLGPVFEDKSSDFANGSGYIQHSEEFFEFARKAMIDIFHEVYDLWRGDADPYARHLSHFCRVADDNGGPISAAFSRLYRIDGRFREWGQPYFALNPTKGSQVCLDDRSGVPQ